MSTPEQMMYVAGIYDYLETRYNPSGDDPSKPWKISVRHTLSVSANFVRLAANEATARLTGLGMGTLPEPPRDSKHGDAKKRGAAGLWTIAPARMRLINASSVEDLTSVDASPARTPTQTTKKPRRLSQDRLANKLQVLLEKERHQHDDDDSAFGAARPFVASRSVFMPPTMTMAATRMDSNDRMDVSSITSTTSTDSCITPCNMDTDEAAQILFSLRSFR